MHEAKRVPVSYDHHSHAMHLYESVDLYWNRELQLDGQ